jgi:hypothetical protein
VAPPPTPHPCRGPPSRLPPTACSACFLRGGRRRPRLPCRYRSIQALLSAPNPDDPLADNVAKHWKDDEPEAIATGGRQRLAHPLPRGGSAALPLPLPQPQPQQLPLPRQRPCLKAARSPPCPAAKEWSRMYAQG